MLTDHARARVESRCREAGIRNPEMLIDVLRQLAPNFAKDTAVRLLRLPGQIGQAWSDRSNGDEVWGIVRHGAVQTVMLRRSTQPATCDALRVDLVTDASSLITSRVTYGL